MATNGTGVARDGIDFDMVTATLASSVASASEGRSLVGVGDRIGKGCGLFTSTSSGMRQGGRRQHGFHRDDRRGEIRSSGAGSWDMCGWIVLRERIPGGRASGIALRQRWDPGSLGRERRPVG